ncbi:hypothetical protein ACFL1G_11390, partial [Planctomycetota bacterium]
AKTKPNKANLKKAKMSLTLYLTRAYKNKWRFDANENKPNSNPKQTQFQTRCTLGREKIIRRDEIGPSKTLFAKGRNLVYIIRTVPLGEEY